MDSSDEEPIDELTVALHLDSIGYDSKNGEYEIELSAVQLTYLDIKNNIVRLKIPSHRLQRIRTPTFNATTFDEYTIKQKYKKQMNEIKSDASKESDDPNLDEITGIILAENDNNNNNGGRDSDDEKREHEIITPITPPKYSERNKRFERIDNIDIKPLNKDIVITEWNKINSNNNNEIITKDGCFKRIIFILKYYTQWITYKDKYFKSQDLPQNEEFLSITSLFNALEQYDKIKLLNDYYWLLDNILLNKDNNNELNEICKLIYSNKNILECSYCINRLNNKNSELYNLEKLSQSLRRDLYFINENNKQIEIDSVDERVEIGIQMYLDILYCSLLTNNITSNGNKYNMEIENNNNLDNYLFGEYFTYWKPEHLQYCKCKYIDLKTELLNNSLYKINQRDFFCLYNRAKDFLLSIMGKHFVSKRIKIGTKSKIKLQQKLTINHIISLLLYTIYYNDFVYLYFIKQGCIKYNSNETFGDIRLRNNEIANWCKLLHETIFCFGDMLSNENKLYYNVSNKIALSYLSIEWNIPISTTNNFKIINKFHNKYKGIILRLGKFTYSKEYNYQFKLFYLSNYPLEYENLIYGGKFEIRDIIHCKNQIIKTHFNDIQSFKLYLKIMKGRWFSHNKLIFKKQYEKKLILFITNYLNNNNNNYMQSIFNNVLLNNDTIKKNKIIYINKECDKLLPELKKLITNKLVPYLLQNKHNNKDITFKKGYNKVLMMKLNFNTINNSSFNKSLYSTEYKYQLLYLKNNRPQEIIFHFRCYKKYDVNTKKSFFKGCFEIKQLPKCVSKCKIIGGILLPQIQFVKWDFITLSHQKLYSGSSLFDLQQLKNFDSVLVKIAFQIKEVTDIDEKIIPTIDL